MKTAFTSPEAWADDEAEKSAPYLCMRLMCSQDPAEVETVQNELSKAGIVTEAREHPLAQSLGVNGIELWVQEERDFYNAAKLYAGLQDRAAGRRVRPGAAPQAEAAGPKAGADQPEAAKAQRPSRGANGSKARNGGEPYTEALEQASSLLEKEIKEVLNREGELAAECTALQNKVQDLDRALAEGQAALAREAESRAEAERAQAEKLSDLQRALWRERAERGRAEEQLGRDRQEWEQQLKSRDEALKDAQQKLGANSELLETEQAAARELREQVGVLEMQRGEQEKFVAEARAEAAKEMESRLAAEERAAQADEARAALEKRVQVHERLEKQMQAHVASIQSLCGWLQAKKVGAPHTDASDTKFFNRPPQA